MNKNVNLYTISIDDFVLVNNNINDPVYKFCILNNIRSLGEFIDIYTYKYKNGEMTRYNNDYFNGVIDLIKLFYLNESMRCKNILLEEICLEKHPYRIDEYQALMHSELFKEPLRRLGLTNNESSVLLYHVIKSGISMTVISAMNSYIQDKNHHIIVSKKEQEIFLKKLKTFINYYNNNSNEFINLPTFNNAEIRRLFQKRNDLLLMKLKIDAELNEVEKELKDRVKNISNGDLQKILKK